MGRQLRLDPGLGANRFGDDVVDRPRRRQERLAGNLRLDRRSRGGLLDGAADELDEIELLLVGQLAPDEEEVVLGTAEVRAIFKVPRSGTVAGCYVIEGVVQRGAKARLLRDGVIIHDGVIASLKRFKDDVREVASGFECGIGLENFNDVKEGDIIDVRAPGGGFHLQRQHKRPVVLIGGGWLLFDVAVRGSLLLLTAVCLLGAMTFCGLGLLIASRVTTIEGASGLANLVMLPMWLLSGVFFSSERFPEAVQPVINALPLTALNQALRGVITEARSLPVRTVAASARPVAGSPCTLWNSASVTGP